jgi:hypothetical protein
MKLFHYWTKETATLSIQGGTKPASVWGGSNASLDEARQRAQEKLALIQERINQGFHRRDPDYETEIREEIIEELNPRNLVSRNRYCALVLNSEDTCFIDIDAVPLTWSRLVRFLTSFRFRSEEEAMLDVVRDLAAWPKYQGLSFRVYRTRKGFRVIAMGRLFEPRAPETTALFRDFQADRLYARLCWRQNCFRARLTPKASRMRLPGHKVTFPRAEAEQAAIAEWLSGYEARSVKYAVCHYLGTIGLEGDSHIVSYHDRMTKAHQALTLA